MQRGGVRGRVEGLVGKMLRRNYHPRVAVRAIMPFPGLPLFFRERSPKDRAIRNYEELLHHDVAETREGLTDNRSLEQLAIHRNTIQCTTVVVRPPVVRVTVLIPRIFVQ